MTSFFSLESDSASAVTRNAFILLLFHYRKLLAHHLLFASFIAWNWFCRNCRAVYVMNTLYKRLKLSEICWQFFSTDVDPPHSWHFSQQSVQPVLVVKLDSSFLNSLWKISPFSCKIGPVLVCVAILDMWTTKMKLHTHCWHSYFFIVFIFQAFSWSSGRNPLFSLPYSAATFYIIYLYVVFVKL